MSSLVTRKIAATCTVLGLATVGIAAAPKPANAWWSHYGCCWGGGFGVFVPPIVVAPPPTYYPSPAFSPPPAPVYYAPAKRAWIPAHWQGSYWVPGHWS
jgi:hypothetical protein